MIARLPGGYDTTLVRWFVEGVQLSGGEWQKVARAAEAHRAIVTFLVNMHGGSI